ncbi:rsbT co-antagonist protein RsbR [Bacillus ectoiniformans]|uniref:STAS domain-containing protein n=1 Tax=Bacillus ectoiniformans TaxID=1494429 RepID=UPI00195B29FE|nr:STAS domain-containing protein [Bacillus ectoiniformans]MBM7648535.1 rsbT co-antagonist protein RsbR [Bacillus ectoiniformans]
MENELRFLGEKILERRYQIAERIHENTKHQNPDYINVSYDEIIEVKVKFIEMFGDILVNQPEEEAASRMILSYGKEMGQAACQFGISLDEALKSTTEYRTYIWEELKKIIKENDMSIDTVFDVNFVLDPLLDQAVYAFSSAYVHFHQETLEKSKMAFLELSVPVVPITTGVAILPLIGHIDTERASLLMEEVLQKATKYKLTHLLFDLSGVLVVDTMVADQIFKIVDALSLLGVKTMLIGIRPEVAQTMVTLGVDFSGITIEANLEQALKHLQQSIKLFS